MLGWHREDPRSGRPPSSAALPLSELVKGCSDFSVGFSRSLLAGCLWEFGEDSLADRALDLSIDDLLTIQRIAAHYECPQYPLPFKSKQHISHGHVYALAAITLFEGAVRPLTRERRRPKKDRPTRFDPLPPTAAELGHE